MLHFSQYPLWTSSTVICNCLLIGHSITSGAVVMPVGVEQSENKFEKMMMKGNMKVIAKKLMMR